MPLPLLLSKRMKQPFTKNEEGWSHTTMQEHLLAGTQNEFVIICVSTIKTGCSKNKSFSKWIPRMLTLRYYSKGVQVEACYTGKRLVLSFSHNFFVHIIECRRNCI
ncbi:hypothetical protein CW304_11705 [Bacillus sp. UFRGS-B20]|nr:hypothetical protein CW304_11705 [Bacillus sp. UFRGS-B20]